jgi:carbonic anhydrase
MQNRMTLAQLQHRAYDLPASEFGTQGQLLTRLGNGQQPVAVMLTCWELGGTPDEISHANPGEVMVVQNPAGIVPCAEFNDRAAAVHSILFGVLQPSVGHLIVCGHVRCQTLSMLLNGGIQDAMAPTRELIADVAERWGSSYHDLPTPWRLEVAVQENIIQQLIHLRSYPEIRSRLQQGNLQLHGWIYDERTSIVVPFNPDTGQFDSR